MAAGHAASKADWLGRCAADDEDDEDDDDDDDDDPAFRGEGSGFRLGLGRLAPPALPFLPEPALAARPSGLDRGGGLCLEALVVTRADLGLVGSRVRRGSGASEVSWTP